MFSTSLASSLTAAVEFLALRRVDGGALFSSLSARRSAITVSCSSNLDLRLFISFRASFQKQRRASKLGWRNKYRRKYRKNRPPNSRLKDWELPFSRRGVWVVWSSSTCQLAFEAHELRPPSVRECLVTDAPACLSPHGIPDESSATKNLTFTKTISCSLQSFLIFEGGHYKKQQQNNEPSDSFHGTL